MAGRARPVPMDTTPQEDVFATKEGFVTTGSFLLDRALGGGWAQGRVVNVVGDRSSGKTLLAIEACANFERVTPIERLRYAEAEAAFSEEYAQSIGFPIGMTMVPEIDTVEALQADLSAWVKTLRGDAPALYVLDSLDALSDATEMESDFDKATYGTAKPKLMSKLFRTTNNDMEKANVTLFIISQIRDKIGVTFGETKTRSGGRALDFYCSQILWLSEIGKIKRTVSGNERVVGLHVRALVKKNKVGTPFRECDLTIQFGYGVDDELSMIDWLVKHKVLTATEGTKTREQVAKLRSARDSEGLHALNRELREITLEKWEQIEDALAPPMRKYE